MKIRIFANLPQSGKSTEEQGFGGGKNNENTHRRKSTESI